MCKFSSAHAVARRCFTPEFPTRKERKLANRNFLPPKLNLIVKTLIRPVNGIWHKVNTSDVKIIAVVGLRKKTARLNPLPRKIKQSDRRTDNERRALLSRGF